MNLILCPSCFAQQPITEEKCCSHGCGPVRCTSCGALRAMGQDPPWHCLGTITINTSAHEPAQPKGDDNGT